MVGNSEIYEGAWHKIRLVICGGKYLRLNYLPPDIG